MKLRPGKKHILWGATALIVIVLAMVIYAFMFRGASMIRSARYLIRYMMSLVFGVIIAYILNPVLNVVEEGLIAPRYERRGLDLAAPENRSVRRRVRKVSIAIVMGGFVLLLILGTVLIVPQIFTSLRTIILNLNIYFRNVHKLFNRVMADHPEMYEIVGEPFQTVSEFTQNFIRNNILPRASLILGQISRSAISLVQGFIYFTVGIIAATYLLNMREELASQGKKMAYAFFPENAANEIIGGVRFIHYTFTGFFAAKIIDSFIILIISLVVTGIMRTPFYVLVSVVVGVTNVIPFFGPYIGGIVGFLIVFIVDPLAALYFLIFVILLQQLDGNILGPAILGQSTGLHAFWVMFAILLFGGIMGPAGWFVGVPIFAVFYAFVARITNYFLRKKGLPEETEAYEDTAYILKGKMKYLRDKENTAFHSSRPQSAFRRFFHVRRSGSSAHAKNSDMDSSAHPAGDVDRAADIQAAAVSNMDSPAAAAGETPDKAGDSAGYAGASSAGREDGTAGQTGHED